MSDLDVVDAVEITPEEHEKRLAEFTKLTELPNNEDRYERTGVVKKGGMGAVYEARDLKFGWGKNGNSERMVMIKEPRLPGGLITEALRKEVSAHTKAADKHFLHVQRIYDYFETGNPPVPHFVMERNYGASVEEKLITNRGGVAIDVVLDMLNQLAPVVDEMNADGAIHRDIKPANILEEKGIFKITDFGISSGVMEDNYNVIGTPQYMAPESITGSPPDYSRADAYALAVTAYRMLTGESYLENGDAATDVQELFVEIVSGERTSISKHQSFVDKARASGMDDEQIKKVADIFDKQLSVDPKSRYANATEFTKSLQDVFSLSK